MKFSLKHAAMGIAAAAAVLLLPATPALASTHAASTAITGPEIAYGAVYGKAAIANNPVVPLTWRGLVNAHGPFSGGSGPPAKGQEHTFSTSAGNLVAVVTAAPVNTQGQNVKACRFWGDTYVTFTVVGSQSTGAWAGTSGPGVVRVYFAGYGPRYTSGPKKGQCNTSPSAPELAKGAVETFLLSAVLTKP